jgi:hypothetical protein
MTAPTESAGDWAAVLAEIAALRARVEALEQIVLPAAAAAAPPPASAPLPHDWDETAPDETRIEPPDPWNLGPPGGGRTER